MTPLMRKFFLSATTRNLDNTISPFDQTKLFLQYCKKLDIGFFDVSNIAPQIVEISDQLDHMFKAQAEDSAFAQRLKKPYPMTWIEFSDMDACLPEDQEPEAPFGLRTAFVAVTDPDTGFESAFTVFGSHATQLDSDEVMESTFEYVGGSLERMKTVYATYARLCLSTFWLLNTRGSVEMDTSHSSRLKSRGIARHWANKLSSHHTLHLCIDGKRVSAIQAGTGGSTGVMPYHIVRGHLHNYWTREGLIEKYVEPFWRGNRDVGTVTKDYVVKP